MGWTELGARLAERWPDRDPEALASTVRARLALVQLPPRGVWGAGGRALHTTVEAWLGEPLVRRPVSRRDGAALPRRVRPRQRRGRAGLVGGARGCARRSSGCGRACSPSATSSGHGAVRPARTRRGPRPTRPRRPASSPSTTTSSSPTPTARASSPPSTPRGRARVWVGRCSCSTGSCAAPGRSCAGATATLAITPFAPLGDGDRSALAKEGAKLLAFAAREAPDARHSLRAVIRHGTARVPRMLLVAAMQAPCPSNRIRVGVNAWTAT